jgi:hypothetical protein
MRRSTCIPGAYSKISFKFVKEMFTNGRKARDVTTSGRKDSTRKKENSVGFFFLPFPVDDEPKTKGA